jgi:hypothetical protein
MDSHGEENGRAWGAGQPADGRGEAAVIEEDVFAKQEKLFTDVAADTPPQAVG